MTELVSIAIEVAGRPATLRYPPILAEIAWHSWQGIDYPVILPPGRNVETIVDIGSNIGATALYFTHLFPSAAIHCYEPFPAAFALLEENTRPFTNIHRNRCAVGARAGRCTLFHGADHCAQNSLFPSGCTGSAGEEVPVLDAARLPFDRIDILKIDAEGAELEILSVLPRLSAIDCVQLEYHSDEDRAAIERLLSPTHFLAAAHATKIHRGRVVYSRKALWTEPCWYRIETGGGS